jgi:hypothetical protein
MHKIKNRKYLSLFVLLFFSTSLFFAPFSYALELVVSGNGSGSDNQVGLRVENQTTVDQTNEANIENTVAEEANTGQNSASENSGGDVNIQTGDVSSYTSITNEINNSYVETGCCSSSTKLTITENGSGSVNSIDLHQERSVNVNVVNNANVINEVKGSANTGQNKANKNTNANVSINTGSIRIMNEIVNAPVNVSGVSVKAGLSGVSASIKNNGSGSVNLISTKFSDDVSVYVNHSSNIENYVLWEANTGGNEASGNSGGDVDISTGDIDIGVFVKNFVNIGGVKIDCCRDVFDPGDDDKDDDPDKEAPTDEDKDKDEDKEKEVQGMILPFAAATEAGGPGIIGLSDTSSQNAKTLFFWLSFIFVSLGGKIVVEELLSKASLKKLPRQ